MSPRTRSGSGSQRYGVIQPERTAGGQRRYSQRDVARVEWLRDRLAEGWRIGEAARALGTSEATASGDPTALLGMLVAAAQDGDVSLVGLLLDQAFAIHPLALTLDEVLVPFLEWVGDGWHRGEVSIAVEHAITGRIRGQLEQILLDPRGDVNGRAVLAAAPGEHHELGLLMIATLLRASGWDVEYLGASLPVADAIAYARGCDATVLCFSTTREESFAALRAGLDDVRGELPPIIVGGRATGTLPTSNECRPRSRGGRSRRQ